MWPKGLCNFWVGVPPPLRRRPPPSRHVPLAHPAEGGDVRSGLVHGPSRPCAGQRCRPHRPGPIPGGVGATAGAINGRSQRLGSLHERARRPECASSLQLAASDSVDIGTQPRRVRVEAVIVRRVGAQTHLPDWFIGILMKDKACAHVWIFSTVKKTDNVQQRGVGAMHPCIGSDPIANSTTDREGRLMCCIEGTTRHRALWLCQI